MFSGEIPFDEMNKAWWDLRLRYQGVAPPVNRSEHDFDPGAKYHVPANTPYIRLAYQNLLKVDPSSIRVENHFNFNIQVFRQFRAPIPAA